MASGDEKWSENTRWEKCSLMSTIFSRCTRKGETSQKAKRWDEGSRTRIFFSSTFPKKSDTFRCGKHFFRDPLAAILIDDDGPITRVKRRKKRKIRRDRVSSGSSMKRDFLPKFRKCSYFLINAKVPSSILFVFRPSLLPLLSSPPFIPFSPKNNMFTLHHFFLRVCFSVFSKYGWIIDSRHLDNGLKKINEKIKARDRWNRKIWIKCAFRLNFSFHSIRNCSCHTIPPFFSSTENYFTIV